MSDPSKPGPEHRSSERIHLALEIGYRSAGAFLVSYSVNLSRGGLFVESKSPAPIGTMLELHLHAPDEPPLALRGQVAWVRYPGDATPDAPPGMGIALQTLEERYGALIDRIASRFQGIRILLALGAGHERARQMLHRHLAAIVACQVDDLDDPFADLGPYGEHDLALINLDWNAGEQTLVHLRDGLRQLPILALSRNPAVREHALALGATRALASPPGFPELRTAVIATLARPSSVHNSY